MQLLSFKLLGGAVAFMALTGQVLRGNADTNPYATIVDRNPFGLKPPPPPPAPPEQTAAPVPMAKVTMTGLLSTFGEPRVLLEIVEEPGKGAGTPKKPILREGERLGPVEILSIDVVKNTVRIRNSGVETNITFEIAKSGPTPGGPGGPGAPPAFTPPAMSIPPAIPPPALSSANNPNGPNNGGGVTLMGGGNTPANPAATVPTPWNPANPSANPASPFDPSGKRAIPSRALRTDPNFGTPAPPAPPAIPQYQ